MNLGRAVAMRIIPRCHPYHALLHPKMFHDKGRTEDDIFISSFLNDELSHIFLSVLLNTYCNFTDDIFSV